MSIYIHHHTSKSLSFCFCLWLGQQKSTFFQCIIPPKISKRHALTASCLRLVDKTEAQREHLQPANWQPANWPTKNVPKESEGLLPKSIKVYLKYALKSIRFSLLKWWNISHKKKLPQGNSTSWHEFTFYHLRKVAQPQKLATGPPCCGHVNDNPSIVSYFNRFSWELRPSQTDPL